MIRRVLRRLGFDLTRLNSSGGSLEEYRLTSRKQPLNRVNLSIVSAVVDCVPVRFAIHLREDHIQRHHFKGEFYEANELQRIAHYFNGGTFVDVGANVGNHTLYVSKFLNAERVIAFEPGFLASTILRCNIALNDLHNVEVKQMGLSDKPGTATLDNSMPYNLGAAKVETDKPGDICIVRGDDVLEAADFIKIDTEGLELQVLNGLRNTVLTHKPILFVEVEGRNEEGFREFLSQVEYEVLERIPSYEDMANWIAGPRA